jgi:hypothetical protein
MVEEIKTGATHELTLRPRSFLPIRYFGKRFSFDEIYARWAEKRWLPALTVDELRTYEDQLAEYFETLRKSASSPITSAR